MTLPLSTYTHVYVSHTVTFLSRMQSRTFHLLLIPGFNFNLTSLYSYNKSVLPFMIFLAGYLNLYQWGL